MNYTYHGIYMRESLGPPRAGYDRVWVYITSTDCSLVIKVPSSYSEAQIQSVVESIRDPNAIKLDPAVVSAVADETLLLSLSEV